jgi:metal-responsive CopG/Arc/MetJ family transcriptional regulator
VPQKKRGRPTENPKSKKISVRLDDETLKVLDTYCEKNNVSRTEGIRKGISTLKE